ncbi:hypothetical protein ETB97_009466 [Aspergillus alliaceus]|uniref:Uncharacterized protein n=1 Tax=Petromyces alliaceus TaxID=209559 RepID=A0A8H5ZT98_PETAA|nr:hypothetical protein ETB97_009466 [Aspergillus burnettii]
MLSPETLTQALVVCIRSDIYDSTRAVQIQARDESGPETATQAFYRWLPPQIQSCSITEMDLVMYQLWNRLSYRISPEAVAILLEERLIKRTDILQKSSAFEYTAICYWNGVSNAAKDTAAASDLKESVSDDDSVDKPERRNLAKDVGIGTASSFGNIALLPFTSGCLRMSPLNDLSVELFIADTALVVNTVAYGGKVLEEAEISPNDTSTSHELHSSSSQEYAF